MGNIERIDLILYAFLIAFVGFVMVIIASVQVIGSYTTTLIRRITIGLAGIFPNLSTVCDYNRNESTDAHELCASRDHTYRWVSIITLLLAMGIWGIGAGLLFLIFL